MSKKSNEPNHQDLLEKIAELESSYQRARADYANLEKRVQSNQQQFASLVTATILSKFINIVDNLEMAAAHINDQGVKMILDQMRKLLEDEQVTPVKTVGKTFDPNIMECTELVAGEKDKVVTEVQKGYWLMNKHLIRPAKVTVGDGSSNKESN